MRSGRRLDAAWSRMSLARSRSLALTPLLAAGIGAACADLQSPSEANTIVIWEATLAPVSSPDQSPDRPIITGDAAAIVRSNGTEAGIAVDGAPPDALLLWAIQAGDCEAPGETLPAPGGYPTLTAEQPDATVQLPARLVQSNAYHVAVRIEETGERLSCGELIRRE